MVTIYRIISSISPSKSYSRVQPNSVSALVASPNKNSTSHGLKYFSSILTNILPVDFSLPTSFIPLPDQLHPG